MKLRSSAALSAVAWVFIVLGIIRIAAGFSMLSLVALIGGIYLLRRAPAAWWVLVVLAVTFCGLTAADLLFPSAGLVKVFPSKTVFWLVGLLFLCLYGFLLFVLVINRPWSGGISDQEVYMRYLYSTLIASAVACVTVFGIALLLVIFAWGENQVFTPEYVEHRVGVGMTRSEVADSLGIPADELKKYKLDDTGYIVRLNKAGLGKWLVPQYEVDLWFNYRNDKLESGWAVTRYKNASYFMRFDLRSKD
ncbi:MAG: hypothetical protein ACYC2Y_10615 [Armatimonadota bacterium]